MPIDPPSALDRARGKAYRRLLPILFVCYVIAYIDRTNVGLAAPRMKESLGFDNAVIGVGAGFWFFIGYLLLEIPGTLLVEKWSARKWICRIMISWGFVAALTALVRTEHQFYGARFLLGLAEAGFFPGVIVYLTHWFPSRDRARALAWFLIASPVAQTISPKISHLLLRMGTDEQIGGRLVHHATLWGLEGWQWMFIGWGLPAVAFGFVVLAYLTDWPHEATWLDDDEREALVAELAREKALRAAGGHMGLLEALGNPKVLLLTAAYFFVVTGNYGVEIFLPTILKDWYHPSDNLLTWVLMVPALGSLAGQLFVGWSSDRTKERRLHTAIPIYLGAIGLAGTLMGRHPLPLMIVLFTMAAIGIKAYLPAFWTLPSLFLTEAAAAGSIGLINSVGNLGGAVGPSMLGWLEKKTNSFLPGILILSVSMAISATIIVLLGLGRRVAPAPAVVEPPAEAVVEPV